MEARHARQSPHVSRGRGSLRLGVTGEFDKTCIVVSDTVSGGRSVELAGDEVGCDDPSHFSREYKMLFGEPPIRDLERLRSVATSSTVGKSPDR